MKPFLDGLSQPEYVHSAAEIGIDDFSFLERIAHKPRKKEFTSFRLILGSISFRAAS